MVATTTRDEAGRTQLLLLCLAAWLLPGSGHLLLGRRQKGAALCLVLLFMFVFGLGLSGRLFPFHVFEPLVVMAAIADLGLGLPWVVAKLLGYGAGDVVAVTFEYGNTFLIVAGLLNMLVVLDTYDIAVGRKEGGA
ncbi:MAG: hypothetical protein GEV06_01110 [Luteitalea sp.]|nr:hypothetical protein [Luteitalea sp.]